MLRAQSVSGMTINILTNSIMLSALVMKLTFLDASMTQRDLVTILLTLLLYFVMRVSTLYEKYW